MRRAARVCALLLAGAVNAPSAQHAGAFRGSLDDPAIAYSTAALDNAVVDVNRKLQDGRLQFGFDTRSGFLQSALDALQLPIDSQLLVFSRGSLQGKRSATRIPARSLQRSQRSAVRGGPDWSPSRHSRRRRVLHARTAGRLGSAAPNAVSSASDAT